MTNTSDARSCSSLAACAGACTITDTEPPPLSGPSEMSLSLAINAEPGRAFAGWRLAVRSLPIEARDVNGQPVANSACFEISEIEGGDFGTLSARIGRDQQQRPGDVYLHSALWYQRYVVRTCSFASHRLESIIPTRSSRVVNIRLTPPGSDQRRGADARLHVPAGGSGGVQTVRFDGIASTASTWVRRSPATRWIVRRRTRSGQSGGDARISTRAWQLHREIDGD